MPDVLRLEIAPRLEELVEFMDAVAAFSEEQGMAADKAYALQLALDELLTNVIEYGYLGRELVPIVVDLRRRGEQVEAEIVDAGLPFDPTAAGPPDLESDLEDRPIGGLGVHLVRTLVRGLAYDRPNGRNRVRFDLPIA